VPALLSLVFVPPSIAAAILHHASPPQPVVPPHANHSFPPSGSGRHARFHAPARLGHRTAATHLPRSCLPAHTPPPAPPPVACHLQRHLLRLPSTEGRRSSVRRGTSSDCSRGSTLLRHVPITVHHRPPTLHHRPDTRSPLPPAILCRPAACSPLSIEETPPPLILNFVVKQRL
jgi:hypothetical protein